MYCQLRYDVRPYGHYAPTNVEFYHEMHGPDNCGEHCVSRSRAGVTSGVEECDVSAGDVDLLRSGSDKQQCCMFSSVVCASPTGSGGSGNKNSDICVRAVPGILGVPVVPGVPGVPHGPDNCGEMCVTRSYAGGPGDGNSDIWERAVPGILGVPGVPRVSGVPHGPENCAEMCVFPEFPVFPVFPTSRTTTW